MLAAYDKSYVKRILTGLIKLTIEGDNQRERADKLVKFRVRDEVPQGSSYRLILKIPRVHL